MNTTCGRFASLFRNTQGATTRFVARTIPLALILLSFLLAGCGGSDSRTAREDFEDRFQDITAHVDDLRAAAAAIRADAERITDDVIARVQDVLEDLQQVVPEAGPQTQRPTTGGRTGEDDMERFLTSVIEDV